MKLSKIVGPSIGVLFLVLSFHPLYLMGQEEIIGHKVDRDFTMDPISVNFMELGKVEILGRGAPIPVERITVENDLIDRENKVFIPTMADYVKMTQHADSNLLTYARTYKWEGQAIVIQDQFHPGAFNEWGREQSDLSITVNDKDYTVKSHVEVRPNALDDNRYHGYLGVMLIKEKGIEKLAVIQRTSGTAFTADANLTWRILLIESNGQVKEDRFSYEERAERPERVKMINLTTTSPFGLGFRSNILQGWPNLFIPLLYPFGTAFVGILLVGVGLVRSVVERRN